MKYYIPNPAPAIESRFKEEPETALLPNEPKSMGEVLRMVQAALPRCVEVLVNIINDPTQYGNTRVAAIKELREWGLGDVARAMSDVAAHDPKNVTPRTPFERLSSEDRIERAKQVARMLVDEQDNILTGKPDDTGIVEMVPGEPDKNEPRN